MPASTSASLGGRNPDEIGTEPMRMSSLGKYEIDLIRYIRPPRLV